MKRTPDAVEVDVRQGGVAGHRGENCRCGPLHLHANRHYYAGQHFHGTIANALESVMQQHVMQKEIGKRMKEGKTSAQAQHRRCLV